MLIRISLLVLAVSAALAPWVPVAAQPATAPPPGAWTAPPPSSAPAAVPGPNAQPAGPAAGPPPAAEAAAPTAEPHAPPEAAGPAAPTAAPVRNPWPRAYPVIPYGAPMPAPAPAAAPQPPPLQPPVTAPNTPPPQAPTGATAPPAQPPYAQPPPAGQPPYAPATPYDPASAEAPPPVESKTKGPCALGQFCFGPVFTLGIANIIGVGAHARYGKYFGFGFDYQFTPTVGYRDAEFDSTLITFDVRGYPTGGALFISGGFAYQMFEAEAAVTYAGTTYTGIGTVDLPLLKLGIGFFGRNGLVLGIDLAIEIPLASADVQVDAGQFANDPLVQPAYAAIKKELEETADDVVGLLPFVVQLNLLRIGYVF